jgi:hypothetical protein
MWQVRREVSALSTTLLPVAYHVDDANPCSCLAQSLGNAGGVPAMEQHGLHFRPREISLLR